MIGSSTAILYVGKDPLINYHEETEWLSPFFLMCIIQNIQFAHQTFSCDVCHIAAMRYSSWNSRFLLVSTAYSLTICVLIWIFEPTMIFKWVSLYLLLILAVASKVHFVYNIVNEICDELGIRVFKVKPKQEDLINQTVQ